MYLNVSPYREVLDGIASWLAVNEGQINLTGPAGVGKTALCERLVARLANHDAQVVHCRNPPATVEALHAEILQQLHLPATGEFSRTLNEYFSNQLESQRKLVLLVDDAHKLGMTVFKEIRTLCDSQHEQSYSISLILCGREVLDGRFAQAGDRTIEHFSLAPLSLDEFRNFYWQYWRQSGQDITVIPPTAELNELLTKTNGLPGILTLQLGRQEPASASHPRTPTAIEKSGTAPSSSTGLFSTRWIAIEIAVVVALVVGAYVMHQSPATSPAPTTSAAPVTDTATTTQAIIEPVVEAPVVPPAPATVETTATEVPAVEAPPAIDAPPSVDAPPPVNPAPPMIVAVSQTEVEVLLKNWTNAWEQQNLDGYFANYATDFAPANQSREAWQAQRQRSIGNASKININWRDLTVEPEGDNQAVVQLWLDYASATYSDSTLKQLQLRRVDGTLHITAENNLRVEKR